MQTGVDIPVSPILKYWFLLTLTDVLGTAIFLVDSIGIDAIECRHKLIIAYTHIEEGKAIHSQDQYYNHMPLESATAVSPRLL